jgi:ribosomal protein L13E
MIATPTRRAVAEPSSAEYVADPANPVRPASTMNTVTLRQGEEQQRGHGLQEVTTAGLCLQWRTRHDSNV